MDQRVVVVLNLWAWLVRSSWLRELLASRVTLEGHTIRLTPKSLFRLLCVHVTPGGPGYERNLHFGKS